MTEQSNKVGSINAQGTPNGDAGAARDATSAEKPPASGPLSAEARKASRKRKLLAGVLGVVVLAILIVFGIPRVKEMLNTVSTDDAYSKWARDVRCTPCGGTDFPRSGG